LSTENSEPTSIFDITDEIIGRLTPAMAEIFSVSAVSRKMLQDHKDLNAVNFISFSSLPQVKMLYQLVNAIDTEIIIIHGQEKKGFVVQVSGCSDCKLFSLAIAANLIQSEKKKNHIFSKERDLISSF